MKANNQDERRGLSPMEAGMCVFIFWKVLEFIYSLMELWGWRPNDNYFLAIGLAGLVIVGFLMVRTHESSQK